MGNLNTNWKNGSPVPLIGTKGHEPLLNPAKLTEVDENKSLADYREVLREFSGNDGARVDGQGLVFENIPAVFLGGLARAYKRKEGQNCISKYLCILNELREEVYNYGLLISLPLNKLELLHDLNGYISNKLEMGEYTEKYASWAKDILSQQFTLKLQQNSGGGVSEGLPTALWPEDKVGGEKAVEFLRRVWGEHIFDDQPILKNEFRTKNLSLYRAISTDFSRNGVPEDLRVWWAKSPKRSKSTVDELLKKYKIVRPEDAFRRNLPIEEAQRLYNAAKSRM